MGIIRTATALVLLGVGFASWYSVGATSRLDPQARGNPGENKILAITSETGHISIASCAGQGCHGQPAPDPLPKSAWESGREDSRWRSSYTIWRSYDPHTRAFADLRNDRSRAIATKLWGPDSVAHEDERCLCCHTNPAVAHRTGVEGRAIQSEGISCESCHGNAEKWIEQHPSWPTGAGHSELYQLSGMKNLSSVPERVRVCTGCHVGAPAEGPLPRRDMNHDFIAAGHPRLNFDFATYSRALPPHWIEKNREHMPPTLSSSPDEALYWAVGRAGVASAELNLLADRASRKTEQTPWPELAEFDCYACHHDLSPSRGRVPRNRSAGSLDWREPFLIDSLAMLVGDKNLPESINQLRIRFKNPSLSGPIAKDAKIAGRRAEELGASLWRERTPSEKIARGLGDTRPASWDEACQFYYAVLAIDSSRNGLLLPARKKEIERVRQQLRLPYHGEADSFQSPKGFDAREDLFKGLLDR